MRIERLLRIPQRNQKLLTFSISCRSSRLLPSRAQVLCAGITAVQMHFPSGAWAEVYSCQPSSGLWKRVCGEVTD